MKDGKFIQMTNKTINVKKRIDKIVSEIRINLGE